MLHRRSLTSQTFKGRSQDISLSTPDIAHTLPHKHLLFVFVRNLFLYLCKIGFYLSLNRRLAPKPFALCANKQSSSLFDYPEETSQFLHLTDGYVPFVSDVSRIYTCELRVVKLALEISYFISRYSD